jgi:RimJ/RimL family protein N-acetyltransferase
MQNLISNRILLHPLQLADCDALFKYRSDPEIYRFQSWQPRTMEDVIDFLKNRIVDKPNLPNTWFQLGISETGSNLIIGDCGIHFLGNDPQQVEVGITIDRKHQGLGYATEALNKVFDYIFGPLQKHRIFASVDPNNRASIRLLERMNMRKEAHFKESLWQHDRWLDDVIYAILSQEWTSRS